MKRQTAREIAVQLICGADLAGMGYCDFAENFMEEEHYSTLAEECANFAEYPDDNSVDYINNLLVLLDEHCVQIDEYISEYSKGWSLRRISSCARAVMRTALCEILYFDDIPVSASINAAVEADKGYDDPEVVAFVNGVLGGFVRGKEYESLCSGKSADGDLSRDEEEPENGGESAPAETE